MSTEPRPVRRPPETPRPRVDRRPGYNPVFEWFFAIIDGISDTVREMVRRGRESAAEAYDEGWQKYDARTKKGRK